MCIRDRHSVLLISSVWEKSISFQHHYSDENNILYSVVKNKQILNGENAKKMCIRDRNVSYQKRADYFLQLIEKFGSSGPIVLDLACGTGSLSMELAQRGCDVIGVDASEDMLSVAQEKAMEHPEWDILYLCQSMTELDLFGTVDTTICALDSINHLTDPRQVQQTFQKVSLFTAPGGLFLFDANTCLLYTSKTSSDQRGAGSVCHRTGRGQEISVSGSV